MKCLPFFSLGKVFALTFAYPRVLEYVVTGLLGMSRGSLRYLPRPVSPTDLALLFISELAPINDSPIGIP